MSAIKSVFLNDCFVGNYAIYSSYLSTPELSDDADLIKVLNISTELQRVNKGIKFAPKWNKNSLQEFSFVKYF